MPVTEYKLFDDIPYLVCCIFLMPEQRIARMLCGLETNSIQAEVAEVDKFNMEFQLSLSNIQ